MANIEQGGQAVRNGVQRLKEGARTGAQRAREKVVNVAERGHEYLHRRRGDRPVKFIRTSPGVEVSTPRTLADVADGIGQQVPVIDVSSRHDTNGFVASNGAVPAPEHSRAVAVADHEEPDDPNERPISLRPRPEPAIATNGTTPDSHRNGSSHNGTGVITGESAHTNGHNVTDGTGLPSVQRNGTALDSSASIPPVNSHAEPILNGHVASSDEESVQPHRNGTSPDGSTPAPLVDSHTEPTADTVSEEQRQEEANRRHLMGVDAYREITGNGIHLDRNSNWEDVLQQLRNRGHMWLENHQLTEEYIKAAIERTHIPRKDWAYAEIQAKGVDIGDTDDEKSLIKKIQDKDAQDGKSRSWNDQDPDTIRYAREAVRTHKRLKEGPESVDGNDHPDNYDEEEPLYNDSDGDEQPHPQEFTATGKIKEREPQENVGVKYLEPELSDDNGYSMYLGPQAMEQWGVHEGERVRAVNDRGQEYFVEVHGAVKRDMGEVEDIDSPYIRMSARAIDHLGFRGEPVIPEIGTVGEEGQKELKLKSAEVVKDVVNTPELRGIHIQEVEAGASSELALTPQMLEMWGVKPGDVITIRHGKVSIPGVTIAESAATDGEDKAPSWDMKLQKEEGEKLKALEGFSLRSKYNKDSKELSVGPSIAVVSRTDVDDYKDPRFEKIAQMAQEYGVMAYIIPPNTRLEEDGSGLYKEGMMWAYTYKDGVYTKVKAPIADVLYEKNRIMNENPELLAEFDKSMFPAEIQRSTHYKQFFAENVLDVTPKLDGYYPKTIPIPDASSAPDDQKKLVGAFLDTHNKVILKPNSGQNGKGVISVTKNPDNTYTFVHGEDEPQKLSSVDEILDSLNAVKAAINLKKPQLGQDYIMQERVQRAECHYKDPLTGEELIGVPEPRLLVQRGADGKRRVVGQLVKMQEPMRLDGTRVTSGGSDIPFHVLDLKGVLTNLYGDEAEKQLALIKELSETVFDAVESSAGEETGELPVDFMLTENKPVILEAGFRANFGTLLANNDGFTDSKYYSAAGPLQRVLSLTGYN